MTRASQKGVAIPIQEIKDVPGRLAAMDGMGIDHQAVFPSLWLGTLAENVELEAVLASSYNDAVAARCKESGGRLHYVAVLPWRRPDLAVAEIKRVKQLGSAVGLFACGMEWDSRSPTPTSGRSSRRPRRRTCPSRYTSATAPAPRSAGCWRGHHVPTMATRV